MKNPEEFLHEQFKKLGTLIYEISRTLKLIGNWSKAKEIITIGLEINLDNLSKGRLKLILAEILLRQADMDEAMKLLSEAEKIAIEVNNKKLLAGIRYSIGEYHYINYFMKQIGSYDIALKYHNDALEIREDIEDKKGLTHSLSRIGVIYERMNDFDKALEYYNHAIDISNEINYPLGSERPITHLAAFEGRKGNQEKALRLNEDALKITEKFHDEESRAFSVMNVGIMQFDIDKDEKKYLESLQMAQEIAEKLDHKICLGFIKLRLARFYTEVGKIDKTIKIYESMIDFAKPIDYKFLEVFALDQISKLREGK